MRRITTYYINKSGMNLDARTMDSKQNPEFFKAHAEHIPDRAELCGQIRESIALWNNTKGEDGRSPAERLADPAPNALSFNNEALLEEFGIWRRKGKKLIRYKFKAEGLELNITGKTLRYLPQASSIEAQAALLQSIMFTEEFHVLYDPTDLEQINLYTLPNGQEEQESNLRFWGYGELKHLSAQMLSEASEAELQAFAKQRALQKAQGEWVDEQTQERRQILAAENILGGAITLERVHKDALNKSKIELQRLQSLGYEGEEGTAKHLKTMVEKETSNTRNGAISIDIYKDRYED